MEKLSKFIHRTYCKKEGDGSSIMRSFVIFNLRQQLLECNVKSYRFSGVLEEHTAAIFKVVDYAKKLTSKKQTTRLHTTMPHKKVSSIVTATSTLNPLLQ
jgi:hypothetical protein